MNAKSLEKFAYQCLPFQIQTRPRTHLWPDASTGKGKSSYYSAMPQARGLKFTLL